MSTTTKTKKEKLLAKIVQDTFWMARRYAHGRHTYAPSMVRDSYLILQKHFPKLVPQNDITIHPPSEKELKERGFSRSDYLDDINL